MPYAVFRKDNMNTTLNGFNMRAARFYGATDPEEIENCAVVKITDELLDRSLYKCVAPDAATTRENAFLVSTPELMYSQERYHYLDEYINVAGENLRLEPIVQKDKFSVTVDAFATPATPPAVGDFVGWAAGSTKLAGQGTTATATTIGKVIRTEQAGRHFFYIIEVTKEVAA